MNSIWSSLLWKEWREHRWKIAAVTAIMLCLAFASSIREGSEGYVRTLAAMLPLFVPIMAVFFGIGAAAGEQSAGTIRFLQALPVRPAKPAAVKLAMGLVASIAPALLAVALGYWYFSAWYPQPELRRVALSELYLRWSPWGIESWFVATSIAMAITGASLFLWSAAAGVNLADEVRAAAIAILVMISYWAAFVGASQFFDADPHTNPAMRAVAAAGPGMGAAMAPTLGDTFSGGLYPLLDVRLQIALSCGLAHLAVAFVYIWRFGRRVAVKRHESGVEQPIAAAAPTWLAPPRSSPASSILWKQIRESAPLAILGAGLILSAILIWAASEWRTRGEIPTDKLFEASTIAWVMTAVFVTIVAGVGVFMEDLKPGIHTFWRSRPIDDGAWFWIKYATALAVTIGSLATIPAVLGTTAIVALGWKAVGGPSSHDVGFQMIAFYLLLQVGVFTVGVLAMILLRQALLGALAALATPFMASIAAEWLRESLGRHAPSSGTTMAITAALVVAAILLAWQALRRDWGWKR